MKERGINIGCVCAVLVEAAVPTGPLDIALLNRFVGNVETYTPRHLTMLTVEEAVRCFFLVAGLYFSLEQKNITPAFVGGVIYLTAGVYELIQSAEILTEHHRKKGR